jgi:hypothetical protein
MPQNQQTIKGGQPMTHQEIHELLIKHGFGSEQKFTIKNGRYITLYSNELSILYESNVFPDNIWITYTLDEAAVPEFNHCLEDETIESIEKFADNLKLAVNLCHKINKQLEEDKQCSTNT